MALLGRLSEYPLRVRRTDQCKWTAGRCSTDSPSFLAWVSPIWPTPLEPMKRLTAHLGGPRLWVKREDATGLGFGGNKLRKLDYVLHEAFSSGADTIVS